MPNVLTQSGSQYQETAGATAITCTMTTPTDVNLMCKPTGIKVIWQSSSTVGNRQIKLTITDASGATIMSAIMVTTLAKDLIGQYSWYVGAPLTGTALTLGTTKYSTFPLPDLILPPGSVLTATDVAAVDNADVASINMIYNTLEPVPQ